ncbi:class I SAM-dependent methyltransferase [Gordonia humi]|uniref:S-adenosyl-L-methionine-dependent methyltransferase n=1 Tax=Gordonia humi TaxID=686429 RepID=A0A840F250_9ACTN|nr:SAM-dependent methyltransferase [Gordonia humi]MBB4137972.1 methyltransferase (TIGR00027 family) [Gordonia humi]
MADERVSGPGTTAVFTAKMRALETDRPQPLIVDPLAQSFVDASGLDYGMVSVSAMTGQRLFESNVIRTWWLDREVRAAIAAGCVQVVILGSGLDSRAFRLATPGTKFFEVESSALAAFKRDAIAATGRSPVGEWSQVEVGIDDEWPAALAAGGYDATVPTCWVAEGMFYLTDDEASRVLTAARSMSAPGSRFLAAHFGQGSLDEAQTREMSTEAQEHSGRGFASVVVDPSSWAQSHGWEIVSARTIGDVGQELGRRVVYSTAEKPGTEYTWLISTRC